MQNPGNLARDPPADHGREERTADTEHQGSEAQLPQIDDAVVRSEAQIHAM